MNTATRAAGLASAMEHQRERLLPCVHCGFCLPACPTYNRLGDEADSPRGRLHLMLAVVEGRLDPGSDAFRTHIDRCLGCRACEPVCPSGVEYGTLLEHARETSIQARSPGVLTRALLAVLGSRPLRTPLLAGGRLLRATGLAALAARVLPARGPVGSFRLALAMLASSAPWKPGRGANGAATPSDARAAGTARANTAADAVMDRTATATPAATTASAADRTVGVLVGCVQQGLYGRVNEATVRVLRANGFQPAEVRGQDCCGALHAHAGALEGARALARRNIEAFERAGVAWIAVNAAGCGAAMKEYGTLLEDDPDWAERARTFAQRVRDATELLAEVGPRAGAPVSCRVAVDHPCHLLHAQGIREAPLQVLAAVPGVDPVVIEAADECCGGAGIYAMTHPELGGRIGADKVAAVLRAEPDVVATPNPGCMMQIGAGLGSAGARVPVAHPLELLDESYRRAGYYESDGTNREIDEA